MSADYQELNRTVFSVQTPQFIKKLVSEELNHEEIGEFTCIEWRKRLSIEDFQQLKGKALTTVILKKPISPSKIL